MAIATLENSDGQFSQLADMIKKEHAMTREDYQSQLQDTRNHLERKLCKQAELLQSLIKLSMAMSPRPSRTSRTSTKPPTQPSASKDPTSCFPTDTSRFKASADNGEGTQSLSEQGSSPTRSVVRIALEEPPSPKVLQDGVESTAGRQAEPTNTEPKLQIPPARPSERTSTTEIQSYRSEWTAKSSGSQTTRAGQKHITIMHTGTEGTAIGSPKLRRRRQFTSRTSGNSILRTLNNLLPDTWGTSRRDTSQRTCDSMDTYQILEKDRTGWTGMLEAQMTEKLGRTGSLIRKRSRQSKQEDFGFLAKFMDSRFFASICAAAVMLNVIFVGYEADASMRDSLQGNFDSKDSTFFRAIHLSFDIFFLVELVLRIYVCRWYFVVGPDTKYNMLDSFLVLVSVIEFSLSKAGIKSASIVRNLRMMKVLRLTRLLRFFSDLRMMVGSIIQSGSSLIWALLLLLAMMYLLAIVCMQGLVDQLEYEGDAWFMRSEVVMWYQNLGRTMITLLQCITSGVSWDEPLRPLAHTSWVYMCVFAFYVTFVVIGVLNVLTGIFVERASRLNGIDRDVIVQSELSRDKAFLEQMQAIFEEADLDDSGIITWDKFREYLKNSEVRAYLAAQQLDVCDARQLFDLLDTNGTSMITLPEFILGTSRLRGQAKTIDLAALLKESRDLGYKMRCFMTATEKKLEQLSATPSSPKRVSYTLDTWPSPRSSNASSVEVGESAPGNAGPASERMSVSL